MRVPTLQMRRRRSILAILLFAANPLVRSFQYHTFALYPQNPLHRARRNLPNSPVTLLKSRDKPAVEPASSSRGSNERETSPWHPWLIEQADRFLRDSEVAPKLLDRIKDHNSNAATSRRMVFAAAAFATASFIASAEDGIASRAESLGRLKWQATPVNKRTGVTVFEAEKDGYNVPFVTYLSRFLLRFDEDCQRWWYSRAAELPRLSKADEIEAIRLEQFAAFSASVEVGLQFYRGGDGPTQLLANLLKRYCPDMETIRASREAEGLTPLSAAAEAQKVREIKEARRQVAILMGLLEKNQPVDSLTKLLAAIDNGAIYAVQVNDAGSGYAPGYGAPFVQFPSPDAGPDFQTATGRATLVPNGRILRLDVVNRGLGYKQPPSVKISPPEAVKDGNDPGLKAAEGRAILFKFGANKGRIERIVLTNPGSGYTESEIIKVKLSSPEMSQRDGGVTATGTAVLEYKVGEITIVDGGSGYVVEKPIDILVEAPPLTARVNMNDPMIANLIPADQLLPETTIPSKEMKKKMPEISDPSSAASIIQRLAMNDGRGGGGGCVGRACYDRGVEAVAFAQKDSYTSLRKDDDAMKDIKVDESLPRKAEGANAEVVSGSTSGPGNYPLLSALGSGVSQSAQLLSLLPEGIGLQYDREEKRYFVKATPEVLDKLPAGWFDGSAFKPLDPEFGPRGRSPIEREKKLDISTYARFAASGAICSSGVHLVLTPIDVVKTKVQTNPSEYPGIIAGFEKVLASGGLTSFFTGWVPTFVGFFIWGGTTYTLTEYLRRVFTDLAGLEASSLEIPIILGASAISATVGAFILCPFEAVRIRAVALSGSSKENKSIVEVLNQMISVRPVLRHFSSLVCAALTEDDFSCF